MKMANTRDRLQQKLAMKKQVAMMTAGLGGTTGCHIRAHQTTDNLKKKRKKKKRRKKGKNKK